MPLEYKITYHGNNISVPMVYVKNRFTNARVWVEKLMMGLDSGEKIIIERTSR